MHAGVHDEADVCMNKVSGRVAYSGISLALAKAVGDCGHGGMVLLSQAAFEQLPLHQLASFGLLLNMGDHLFTKDPSLPPTPIYSECDNNKRGCLCGKWDIFQVVTCMGPM